FEFNKRALKFILLTISALLFLGLLSTLSLLAHLKKEKTQAHKTSLVPPSSPAQGPSAAILAEQMKQSYEQYLQEVRPIPIKKDSILPLFYLPTGFRNIIEKKWLTLEKLDIQFDPDKISVHFNIINTKQDGMKLSGHIFIVMAHGSQISIYPPSPLSMDKAMISFKQGETFTISKFRKVEGFFKTPLKKGSQVTFKVFIFSYIGDLLYRQSIGPKAL
ncbi:MAG: hypothetical protein OXB88_06190, partial [Bacteriovoracales bacterium]|nr:hypothetical protein [Bacteriovoracales bacterium]